MNDVKELNRCLTRWLGWYKAGLALRWGGRGLTAGLLVALLAAGLVIPQGVWTRAGAIQFAAALPAAGLILGAAFAFLRPVSRLEAARLFDHFFDLQERLSTAVDAELAASRIAKKNPDALPVEGEYWRAVQLADALAAARSVQPRQVLRSRLNPRRAGLVISLALGLALEFWWGAPYFRQAEQAQAFQGTAAAEIQEFAAIRDEIASSAELTPEQRRAVSNLLEETVAGLQAAQTAEAAAAVLDQARDQLQSLDERHKLAAALNAQARSAQAPRPDRIGAETESLPETGGSRSGLDAGELAAPFGNLAGEDEEPKAFSRRIAEISAQIDASRRSLQPGEAAAAEVAETAPGEGAPPPPGTLPANLPAGARLAGETILADAGAAGTLLEAGGVDLPLPTPETAYPGSGSALPGELPTEPEYLNPLVDAGLLPEYQQAYRRAVEGGQIPREYHRLIRDYFLSLDEEDDPEEPTPQPPS